MREKAPHRRWWMRLAWFAAIWAVSVATLGIVAWLIRLWLA